MLTPPPEFLKPNRFFTSDALENGLLKPSLLRLLCLRAALLSFSVGLVVQMSRTFCKHHIGE